MYKVMVHAGMQEGTPVVKQGTEEIQLFETREAASNFAMKLRNSSSLGVWCRVLAADAESTEQSALSKYSTDELANELMKRNEVTTIELTGMGYAKIIHDKYGIGMAESEEFVHKHKMLVVNQVKENS